MSFGVVFIIVASLILAFKLGVARSPDGGAPVLDGIVFPPIIATVGFIMLGFARRVGTGDWIYWVLWLALTLFAFEAISYAGKVGDRDSK